MGSRLLNCTMVGLVLALGVAQAALAEPVVRRSLGQTVYVAVYSNVFSGDRALPFNLAAMLSIRNTDPASPLQVTGIDYYNNDGKLLKRHLERPQIVGPLASTHLFVKESDTAGGFGAKFIVNWEAAKEITPPQIESVMIGARSGQGISFISPGQVIAEKGH